MRIYAMPAGVITTTKISEYARKIYRSRGDYEVHKATESWDRSRAKPYRRKERVSAIQIEVPWEFTNDAGITVIMDPGDFLILYPDDHIDAVKKATFEHFYEVRP